MITQNVCVATVGMLRNVMLKMVWSKTKKRRVISVEDNSTDGRYVLFNKAKLIPLLQAVQLESAEICVLQEMKLASTEKLLALKESLSGWGMVVALYGEMFPYQLDFSEDASEVCSQLSSARLITHHEVKEDAIAQAGVAVVFHMKKGWKVKPDADIQFSRDGSCVLVQLQNEFIDSMQVVPCTCTVTQCRKAFKSAAWNQNWP